MLGQHLGIESRRKEDYPIASRKPVLACRFPNGLPKRMFTEEQSLEARAQVKKMACSVRFASRKSAGKLLAYLVNEVLEGRGSQINEYKVGIDVFGMPGTWMDERDERRSIVRREMKKLREIVALYYQEDGERDEDNVRIILLEGGYAPTIKFRSATGRSPMPQPTRSAPPPVSPAFSRELTTFPSKEPPTVVVTQVPPPEPKPSPQELLDRYIEERTRPLAERVKQLETALSARPTTANTPPAPSIPVTRPSYEPPEETDTTTRVGGLLVLAGVIASHLVPPLGLLLMASGFATSASSQPWKK